MLCQSRVDRPEKEKELRLNAMPDLIRDRAIKMAIQVIKFT